MPTTKDSIRVLHVDDEPDLAKLVADFLEREDDRITVDTGTSAREGLDRVTEERFDCIVSDYDMPGQSGIEFLETIREEYPNLPFILYTGKGSEEVASDAIAAGATDYLQKGMGTDQYKLLANRIQNAVEQSRAQQRAAELERIRTLVNDINQALVRANSRSEVENRVCEIISQSDPYLFAWIGEVDAETDRVEPRAWAGVEDGYLDNITVTADETATGRGPGGTAIREQRVAAFQNIHEDPDFEPWREDALERGYQSVAGVPLENNGSLYGVLLVYSDRVNAFDDDERALLAELGGDIGHAIQGFEDQRNLKRFKKAIENAGHAVFVTDDDGTIEYVNPSFETMTGYSADEAVGRNPRILKSGEMSDTYYEELWETVLDGTVWKEEVINRRQDGELYYAHQTIAPILDSNDDIGAYVAIQTDITERKEREEAIESSRNAYQDLFQGIKDAVFVHEPTGRFIAVNEAACSRLGYSEDELLELSAEDIDAPEYAEHAPDRIGTIEEEGTDTFESVHVTKSGKRIPVEIASSSIQYFGKDAILSVARDISGRKERERELRTLSERLDLALEAGQLGVWDWDIETDAVTFDERWAAMLDHSLEEIEPHINEWEQRVHPEDLPKAEAALEAHFAGESEYYQCDHRMQTKSGDWIWIHDVGKVFEVDDDGNPIRAVGIHQDVTEQKRLNQELERQNERLDQFASVVSHDLRNPLNVAQGRLELAQEECESTHLADVAQAHDRMEALIEDLLTLARTGTQIDEQTSVDLADVIDGCWRTVETGDATLVTETDRTIRADPNRLQQLLENLFRNAVEHGDPAVSITVGDLDDGNGFYVSDNGPGISDTERDNVFEAGYSTKDKGTGFGLNIVQEIADAHGWDIAVTDSETGGARFEITGVEFIAE